MLLEREKELGVLSGVLADVGESGGKVILIRGEAGIGKSSLVRRFVDDHLDDAHIYFGSCDDLLTPQPLGPLRDIAYDESDLAVALASDDRSAVLATSLDLLSGSLRPNVMVIEDTHWADEATLDVIKYLGRRIARTNGLLLLTYRDGEVDYEHPLRHVVGDLAPENLIRLRLEPLSVHAVSEVVGDSGFDVEEILRLTDGNPLFVTELVGSGGEGVPLSVRDSVLSRAARLSKPAREVLDLVSVIPGEAEQSLIHNLFTLSDKQITECVRQGLLRFDSRTVSFHHELTRKAIESVLSATERRRLNGLVLVQFGGAGDFARLVHHAREANDVEAIIEYSPKAARAAMVAGSHREALGHFRTLEPYIDRIPETDRASVVDDWARTEFYLGTAESLDVSTRAIALLRSVGDDLALARALTAAVRLNEAMGRPQVADSCAVEAVAILEAFPTSGDLAHAISQQAWVLMMRGNAQQAVEMADRAIELAEESGEELTIINSLNTKGVATYQLLGDPAGLQMLEEARWRAQQGSYPYEETRALLNMALAAAAHRQLDVAADLARQGADTAGRNEIGSLGYVLEAGLAEILMWKGEWQSAEDLAAGAVATRPEVNSLHGLIAGRVLGRLQTRQGSSEAGDTLDRVWSMAELNAEMQNLLPTAAALAEHMWLTGVDQPTRTERFRELLSEGIGLDTPWVAGDLAIWLWILGELPEIPDGFPGPYGLLMDGEAAQAAAIWEEKGVPYEQAIALMHGDQAAQLKALEIFETLGATAVAAKQRRALEDQGVPAPRAKRRDTVRHAAGLTARQAEVLQLLNEGLSNIEIADRLFVSPRTVENHVAAVLAKLGSSTREEAVFRAREEGLSESTAE